MAIRTPAWPAVALAACALLAGPVESSVIDPSGGPSNDRFAMEGDTSLELVRVANPGNGADATGYGAVDYVFTIGKYEATTGQYTRFLNAVAASDPFGLYNPCMWSSRYGCKIERIGEPGGYTYRVAADYANRPVNYVSWNDAARFANWLSTGNTEEGVYEFTDGRLARIADRGEARQRFGQAYFLPTENEWYKAAYHANDGVTANYWRYPTASDQPPGRDLDESEGDATNANTCGVPMPIDSRYFTTEVGQFATSESPYGTFDQGGNVWEWLETPVGDPCVVRRGGSFLGYGQGEMLSCHRNACNRRDYESCVTGFRVPAPGGCDATGGCAGDPLLLEGGLGGWMATGRG